MCPCECTLAEDDDLSGAQRHKLFHEIKSHFKKRESAGDWHESSENLAMTTLMTLFDQEIWWKRSDD